MTATERIAAIGKPRSSVAAHQHYVPVADPKPRGPEGAARRLARTGLPASVTADVAQDIYRMFAEGMTGHERGAHLKFWEWALRGMGAWPDGELCDLLPAKDPPNPLIRGDCNRPGADAE